MSEEIKPRKYEKLPSFIEAIEFVFSPAGLTALKKFCGDALGYISPTYSAPCAAIRTLNGTVTILEGEYVVKGLLGEFYPCKPDLFHRLHREFNEDIVNDETGKDETAKDHFFKLADLSLLDELGRWHQYAHDVDSMDKQDPALDDREGPACDEFLTAERKKIYYDAIMETIREIEESREPEPCMKCLGLKEERDKWYGVSRMRGRQILRIISTIKELLSRLSVPINNREAASTFKIILDEVEKLQREM